MKVGITGQAGFVGTHLYNYLGLVEGFERVPFKDTYFRDENQLRTFVRQCDVIIHLAALNRHPDPKVIYETNLFLVKQLISAMEAEQVTPHLLFSSSTQEERDNEYGRSKREGRILLESWAKRNHASFTGMVVPNVFGPFGRPNYNSFIATFCFKLTHGEQPEVIQDSQVNLIYVGNLCWHIIHKIKEVQKNKTPNIEYDSIPIDFEKKVTEILALFENYKELYLKKGIIPFLKDQNETNLFNTFCSYLDFQTIYPRKLTQHIDNRGVFVEILKLGVGGQISFSTTAPHVTRGNHFHTRKIERFTVIKGKARIQLRRIGTNEVLNFELEGNEPAFIDMPVWYTHNITNVGEEELYTLFWINEWFDPAHGDTYFEPVEKIKIS